MKRKITKKIGVTFGSMGLAVSMIACADGGSNDASSNASNGGDSEEIELTVWLWPGFGVTDLLAQYEEENPHISINLQEAEYGDVHQNLITALAAGSGAPDISGIDEGYLDRMMENPEHFHNLMDYGGADLKDTYLDFKWEQGTNHEEDFLIGVPTDVGPMVMAYRMDLFEEAGLPTDPNEVAEQMSTWEDYIEAGKQLNDVTDGYMFNNLSDLYTAILEQGSPQHFDEDNNFISEESERNLYAWDLATSAEGISANIERHTTEWGAGVAAGEFATVFLPPWMLGNIKEDAPDTDGLWNVTNMPEGSGNFGGSFLSLPAEGDHPEEAYDLATWLMAPEQQLTIFENSGPFPSTPELYDEPAIQELEDTFFTRTDLGALYAEAAEDIVYGYKGPNHDLVNELFQEALGSVEDGNNTPEEAWRNAIDEAERQIGR
ncbi:ABC transporter substrate-binding protein [Salipaludibacillus neizhouensis]|uniref:ABC transporter substrate-binding protein n=1 Tax=Salipaludibacillus neizhouensis TaxID=885475 RepID=A0A3A9K2N4_9BACI|nr:extracellular solute-binding protein [Salipaludibacillus neizhouensis]RKL66967.1 ABC transporter substrate-binding protein [Salipaludibacillus neizhouensis]